MPKLIGTRHHDELFARDARDWIIRGRGGDDELDGRQGDDRLDGGQGHDDIFGNLGNDTLYGRAGDDEIYGGDGDDTAWGGDGQDFIDGGEGNDFMAGGAGNDVLGDSHGYNEVRGGPGDDLVGGTGLICGGPGNDSLGIVGGIYYGDDQAGLSRGDDTFHFDAPSLAAYFSLNSVAIGGQGADTYNVEFCNDGITNRLDVLDFRQGEGDRFDVIVRPPYGQPGETYFGLQDVLDTNGDHVLDGTDAPNQYGMTWADPIANAVVLLTTDGDLLALWGTQAVQLDFIT